MFLLFLFEVWKGREENILPWPLETEDKVDWEALWTAKRRDMRDVELACFVGEPGLCILWPFVGLMMITNWEPFWFHFSSSDCLDASPLLMFASLSPSSRCLLLLCLMLYDFESVNPMMNLRFWGFALLFRVCFEMLLFVVALFLYQSGLRPLFTGKALASLCTWKA